MKKDKSEGRAAAQSGKDCGKDVRTPVSENKKKNQSTMSKEPKERF